VDPCAGAGVGSDDGEISSQSGMGIQFFLGRQSLGTTQSAGSEAPDAGQGAWGLELSEESGVLGSLWAAFIGRSASALMV
jgi:hypothetical protein